MNTTLNILKERAETHGDYYKQAELAEILQHVIFSTPNSAKLPMYQINAIRMICIKISRILIGDNDHVDSWQDIAGYATLVTKEIEGKTSHDFGKI